jgi:hypothetical protein
MSGHMRSPSALPTTSRPSRGRRYFLAALLAGIVLFGGGYYWLFYQANRRIQEAIAEADRLDPGWRLNELEATRAIIPPDVNPAMQVLAAQKLEPQGGSPKWMLPLPNGTGLVDALEELSPQVRLSAAQRKELFEGLQPSSNALKEVKKIVGMAQGRFGVKWSKDAAGTLMPHLDAVNRIGSLLRYEAIARADAGDLVGALEAGRAAVYLGRSIGDEPALVSQFVRLRCSRQAIRSLERVLAQGELAPAELDAFQQLLVDELKHPAQLIAARSARADIHEFLVVTENLGIDRASYQLRASMLGYHYDNLVDMMRARQAHAKWLHYLNECVEITKLPIEEQEAKFAELAMPDAQLPMLLEALFRPTDSRAPWSSPRNFQHAQACLRSAIAALAVERYRLAEGRWPENLNALVPKYISSVPIDPFEGKPLVLLHSKDLGADFLAIQPAKITETTQLWPTSFRLWSVKDRRKASTEVDVKGPGKNGEQGNADK